jgi:hypothetical protein
MAIAAGVDYWWGHGGEGAHETIMLLIGLVIPLLLFSVFELNDTCKELRATVARLEEKVSGLEE